MPVWDDSDRSNETCFLASWKVYCVESEVGVEMRWSREMVGVWGKMRLSMANEKRAILYDDGIALLSTRFLEAEVKKKPRKRSHWAFLLGLFSTRLAFPFDLARLVLLIWSVLICCPKSVGPNLSLCFLYLPVPISSHYSLLPPGFASRPLLRHPPHTCTHLLVSLPPRHPHHPPLPTILASTYSPVNSILSLSKQCCLLAQWSQSQSQSPSPIPYLAAPSPLASTLQSSLTLH